MARNVLMLQISVAELTVGHEKLGDKVHIPVPASAH